MGRSNQERRAHNISRRGKGRIGRVLAPRSALVSCVDVCSRRRNKSRVGEMRMRATDSESVEGRCNPPVIITKVQQANPHGWASARE